MADRENREQEYLRRMRALGYEPSLMGMDDEDIEWELQRMDGRGRETPPPAPLNPTYRPVDPGLAARIFRQMGRPYDPKAISAKQSFYINGWDGGEDEGDEVDEEGGMPAEPMPHRLLQRKAISESAQSKVQRTLIGELIKLLLVPRLRGGARGTDWGIDPIGQTRRPDRGVHGESLIKLKTLEYLPAQDVTGIPSQNGVQDTWGYGAGRIRRAPMINKLYNATGGSGGEAVAKAGPLDKVVGPAGELIQKGIEVERFAKEVEQEALKNGDSETLAKKKGVEAGLEYAGYLTTVAGSAAVANRLPRYGPAIAAGVGVAGTAAGAYAVKPWIKNYVMGKREADYNKEPKESLFPGNMPPGPG